MSRISASLAQLALNQKSSRGVSLFPGSSTVQRGGSSPLSAM